MHLARKSLPEKPFYATWVSPTPSIFYLWDSCGTSPRSARRRQPPHQLLFPSQKLPHRGPGGIRFDSPLHVRQFALDLLARQRVQTALRFFPGRFLRLLEQNLEKQTPFAIVQLRSNFGGVKRFTRNARTDQRCKDFLRFQAKMKLRCLQMLCQFPAKALRLCQHSNQPPLRRLCRVPHELRLQLYFTAALACRLAECRTDNGLIQMQLLRDSRCPL